MPSPLDQDRASHEPEQTLAALDASAHPGEEPVASFEQQPELQAGVGTASLASMTPELSPLSHSLSAEPHPSPSQADHQHPPPTLLPYP